MRKQSVDMSTLCELDDVLIEGNHLSVGAIIKRKAVELFKENTDINSRGYKIMTDGLSSTLDICDVTETSQKSLFKDDEWEYFVQKYTTTYDIPPRPVYDSVISSWKIIVHVSKN